MLQSDGGVGPQIGDRKKPDAWIWVTTLLAVSKHSVS